MSSTFPSGPEPEYLGSSDGASDGSTGGPTGPAGPRGPRRRRWAVLGAAAVGVVGVVAVGGWAALSLMAGGTSPATAVPANAVGYLSLDLDPSAAQKIEAIRILKKFPAVDKQLTLDGKDDLRRWVFEQIQKDGTCEQLSYAKDIEPWIGDRIALAAVPEGKGSATPLLALQVGDQDAARKGVDKLEGCAGPGADAGVAFVGDYLLVSDTQKHADAAAAAAEQSPLEDDTDFQAWMGKAGDPGVVTMYVAKGALPLLAQMQGTGLWPPTLGAGDASDSELALGPDPLPSAEQDRIDALAKDFEGLAGVVRFHDGAVEAEFVGQGLPATMAPDGGGSGPDIGSLPASTAAAFSVAFEPGWLEDYLESMAQSLGDGQSVDELLAEAEAQTGLDLPEDLEALLGDGISVSVDASADLESLTSSPDPADVPFGARIKGDPARITAVIDKLKASFGPAADALVVRAGDGTVALGLDEGYVGRLLERGSLGGEKAFRSVVPEPDRASGVLYLNFDAGDGWAERIAGLLSDGDASARANVAPLEALGISSWADGDRVQHGLFRLTTE